MTLKEINKELEPLSERAIQAYFGSGLHTLGLLHWILSQTGRADVWMSSYSTSEQFLNGFALLKAKGLVKGSMLVLDQRAAKKTVKLQILMRKMHSTMCSLVRITQSSFSFTTRTGS